MFLLNSALHYIFNADTAYYYFFRSCFAVPNEDSVSPGSSTSGRAGASEHISSWLLKECYYYS